MKKALIGTTLLIIVILGISFLIFSGLVWAGCFAFNLLGFSVVFSWKLAFALWIIVVIIRAIIKSIVKICIS